MGLMLRLVVPVALMCASCGQPEVVRTTNEEPTPSAPTESTPSTTAPRIVFLGDSLTAGYGLAKEESVPSLIQKRLKDAGYPYEVINAGVSGDTSAGGLNRLGWSLDGDVKVLVIELGANDGLRGLPVAGLKCIPPHDEAPAMHFALWAKIAARNRYTELSLGLSHDLETAIRFGATQVQFGSDLYCSRV